MKALKRRQQTVLILNQICFDSYMVDHMIEKQTEKGLSPKSNFSEWYNDLLLMGEIMDVCYP